MAHKTFNRKIQILATYTIQLALGMVPIKYPPGFKHSDRFAIY